MAVRVACMTRLLRTVPCLVALLAEQLVVPVVAQLQVCVRDHHIRWVVMPLRILVAVAVQVLLAAHRQAAVTVVLVSQ